MEFLTELDRRTLQEIARLVFCNPFQPRWLNHESAIFKLRDLAVPPLPSSEGDLAQPRGEHPSFCAVDDWLKQKLGQLCAWLQHHRRAKVPTEDRQLFVDVAGYLQYRSVRHAVDRLIGDEETPPAASQVAQAWEEFWRHYEPLSSVYQLRGGATDPAHLFACCFQVRRAFHFIARYIIGQSGPASELRASAWQSIFTCDMRRYLYSLYGCLDNAPTLIVGPSGTGKELVARAVAFSRYRRFCARTESFADLGAGGFHAVNLSAVPATLIESQLFGHRRGSFTGAERDHQGILERCGPAGAVFLDEIGDVNGALQVKLLRVLQTRRFLPVGAAEEQTFEGKILAATNRNLAEAMERGRFRQDLYFRLCGDVITTPSLRDQLADCNGDLRTLVLFILKRELGDKVKQRERESLAAEFAQWIHQHLGADYSWPGNIRELEQCVRNLLIHGEYRPVVGRATGPFAELVDSLQRGALTMKRLESWYCSLVYAQTGSYEETARRLDLDRRTISKRVDQGIVRELPGAHHAVRQPRSVQPTDNSQ